MAETADIVIVGAGIVGLSLARELHIRYPDQKIILLEKEPELGKHASGRNSGVLHSGIYYAEDTIKSKVCSDGAKELAEFCDENGLPVKRFGKLVVPVQKEDETVLNILHGRAAKNGVRAEILDKRRLAELFPHINPLIAKALHLPDSAVIEPITILKRIADDLNAAGVRIFFNHNVWKINPGQKTLQAGNSLVNFGYLFNAAGLFADVIAKWCDAGNGYTILPFKGIYYKLNGYQPFKINFQIYPVPDLRMPFLGIHFTKTVSGEIYIGPSAMPAFGRENYSGMYGINLKEMALIIARLAQQYVINQNGFRNFVYREIRHLNKKRFAEAASALISGIDHKCLMASGKVGIRAQLLDLNTRKLVMDFVVEKGRNSTHVLNAVSPAFTSAFSFSRFVLDNFFTKP